MDTTPTTTDPAPTDDAVTRSRWVTVVVWTLYVLTVIVAVLATIGVFILALVCGKRMVLTPPRPAAAPRPPLPPSGDVAAALAALRAPSPRRQPMPRRTLPQVPAHGRRRPVVAGRR